MTETILLIVNFFLFGAFLIREYLYSKTINEILNRFYDKQAVVHSQATSKNSIIKEEPNEISIDDPEFDIKKINKVISNGQEVPISIQ